MFFYGILNCFNLILHYETPNIFGDKMTLRNPHLLLSALLIGFIASFGCAASNDSNNASKNILTLNPDTVKAGKFDTGKMWTFEHAPTDYFYETYGFKTDEDWLTKVRMSALKFASWCSASFVSKDGLIMTNHHCIDMISEKIQKEGEDIVKNGFIAKTLEDERRVPDLYVSQLVLIKDVTDLINDEVNVLAGENKTGKKINDIIAELEKKYSDETGLDCNITPLYNGGKYSLYGYRKYDDVRVVFFAESEIGLYGGDPDNFTYPRYNLDCAFLRVYEDGKPLETENYLKFGSNGIVEDEPLFVVGFPGTTKRLKTVSQLEYDRDFSYKNLAARLTGIQRILRKEMDTKPEKFSELQNQFILVSNSAKVYSNELKGMQDPYLMARKKAFEENFKNAVISNPTLSAKFGHVWSAIENNRNELRKYAPEYYAYRLNRITSAQYFLIARELVQLASQLSLPDNNRDYKYKSENLSETIAGIFPNDFDKDLEFKKLALQADLIAMNIGKDHPLVQKIFNGETGTEAAEFAISKSKILSKDDIISLAEKGADAIIKSDDPFIQFILTSSPILEKNSSIKNEIDATEEDLEGELGRALYEVYGTSIPPDATFTLRITDCVMKDYEYNGTIAPKFTTFYGFYDRYYSHEQTYPWDITENWKQPEEDFDLSTPFNFVATCDITGGASGSPVLNQRAEVVGLAFDGNIESIPAGFLFTTEKNRMVGLTAEGIVEALEKVYRFKRLSSELTAGRIVSE